MEKRVYHVGGGMGAGRHRIYVAGNTCGAKAIVIYSDAGKGEKFYRRLGHERVLNEGKTSMALRTVIKLIIAHKF